MMNMTYRTDGTYRSHKSYKSHSLKQFLDQRFHFGLEPREPLAGSLTFKPRVNVFHQAVATDVDRRRVSAEIVQLRKLLPSIFIRPGVQDRILDAEAFGEGSELFGVTRRVASVFERERDHLQPTIAVAVVKFLQDRPFVVTVRAPTAGDSHNHDLVFEPLVSRGDDLAVRVGEAEAERFGGVFHPRVVGRIRQTRDARFVLGGQAFGDDLALRVEEAEIDEAFERALRRQRGLEDTAVDAVEAVERQLVVFKRAGHFPPIARNGNDRAFGPRALLFESRAPETDLRFLADAHHPFAADVGRLA